jgi:hypothetical protein
MKATGNVDLLLIAVDNGPGPDGVCGPVMSHYEFIVYGPDLTRMSDSEWQGNALHVARDRRAPNGHGVT